jgi:hypothetical protein
MVAQQILTAIAWSARPIFRFSLPRGEHSTAKSRIRG